MAKQVKLFRFYQLGSVKNYPEKSINYRNLVSGSLFTPYMPITQLGILALPGTKFYLNNATNPIIIGHTGIYELDLDGLSEITSLSFDSVSLNAIDANANSFLIIDIIYEGDGE